MNTVMQQWGIVMGAALMLAQPALAELKSVEITSFRQAGNRQHTTMAELCGKVHFENESLVLVDVTVDRSVRYSVPTDAEGRFCVAVDTRYGQASVTARAPLSSASPGPTASVPANL